MYKLSMPVIAMKDSPSYREQCIAELHRAKADRVFLCLSRSVATAEQKKAELEKLRELLPVYEAEGFETGVWISSLGHGGGGCEDKTYQLITAIGGETAQDSFCPLDEAYAEEFCEWVADIARTGCKMLMLDDDYRLSYRAGGIGCLCPLHMKKICALLGEELSREELAKRAFTGEGGRYRDAFLKADGDSLRELARRLRAAADGVNPDMRFSIASVLSTWDTDGVDSIELAKIFAGRTKPFLRLIGAAYWGAGQAFGCRLANVIETERMQSRWCENEGIELFSEGDVFPRPRFSVPAAYLEIFDTALRADGGLDGILKYMLDYDCSPRYEHGYIDRHAANSGLYDGISRFFDGKRGCGANVFEAMHKLSTTRLPHGKPSGSAIADRFLPVAAKLLCDCSLPMSRGCGGPTVVFGEDGRYIPAGEAARGAVLDAVSAQLLTERGIDCGFRENLGPVLVSGEHFIEDGETVHFTSALFGDGGGSFYRIKAAPTAKYVSELVGGDFGGAFEYENASGARFFVLPFDAYEVRKGSRIFRDYCRARQLRRALEYVGRAPLPAVCEGSPDLYMLCKEGGGELAVGLWNICPDDIGSPVLELGKRYSSAEYLNCQGVLEGEKLKLSRIEPFGFAAVLLKP